MCVKSFTQITLDDELRVRFHRIFLTIYNSCLEEIIVERAMRISCGHTFLIWGLPNQAYLIFDNDRDSWKSNPWRRDREEREE